MTRERQEAAQLLADLHKTVRRPLKIHRMPDAPARLSVRQAACEKAMRMIEAEMLASIARCAELEKGL